MKPLKHPSSVRFIKNGIDMTRSESYNLLLINKKKHESKKNLLNFGKEGPETDATKNFKAGNGGSEF
jgi:hypothetical protein